MGIEIEQRIDFASEELRGRANQVLNEGRKIVDASQRSRAELASTKARVNPPLVHLHSRKLKDKTACGIPLTRDNWQSARTDANYVTCPKCIARFTVEGVRDAED